MEMNTQVKQFLKEFISSVQMNSLYTTHHPIYKKSVQQTFEVLQGILKEVEDVVIGVVGSEFAFERDIFFDISAIDLAKKVFASCEEKGIEKIAFYSHVTLDELDAFIYFLTSSTNEEMKLDPQRYLTSLGIQNISVSKLMVPFSAADEIEDKVREVLDYLVIYENYLKKSSEYLEVVLNNGQIEQLSLKISMVGIMDYLSCRKEFIKLASLKKHDSLTYLHAVNTSVLSMYFSSKLGFSKGDVIEIGIAALFHDIGKMYIGKEAKSSPEESQRYDDDLSQRHTQLGAEMLLNYVGSIGVLPVVVAFEHHMGFDKQGGKLLPLERYTPHPASLIVSICDVYDAYSVRRNYKYDYPPNLIYDIMMKQKGGFFDPDLLDSFFRIIGVWPIGTLVALSDGRIAVVRKENENEIFYPLVEAIAPADKRELIDLRENKTSLTIERALNPFAEGKTYLHYV